MSNDWVPARDSDFDFFLRNINRYVAGKCGGPDPAWTHIPQAARTALEAACDAWYEAYALTLRPHSPVETQGKKDAKNAALAALRPFKAQYLSFPPVMNEDRTAMGIRNRDPNPTPVPPPIAQAEADLVFPGIRQVELRAIRCASSDPGDPRSNSGVRIYYGVLDEQAPPGRFRIAAPPKSGEDLPWSVFTRKKKYCFSFDRYSGKFVYFCLRYENAKGRPGPFGPILYAAVP